MPVGRVEGRIHDAPVRFGDAEEILRDAESLALRYRATQHLAYVYEQMGRLAGARADPVGFLFFVQALDLVRQHRLPPAQYAAVQHAYGNFELATQAVESGLARLDVARKAYRDLGADVDAESVERDIESVREAAGRARERAATGDDTEDQLT